jgi:hypothetical protein
MLLRGSATCTSVGNAYMSEVLILELLGVQEYDWASSLEICQPRYNNRAFMEYARLNLIVRKLHLLSNT